MSQFGSWSVKGVDDRARAVAKEQARMKGITLGDYINNLLLQGHSEAGPRDMEPQPVISRQPTPLDRIAQRIEAVEARSTLAITGIDQSVLGLLARLENTENSSSAMAAEVEAMIDGLRETHEALQDKVSTLESDDSARQSLEAMKALEDALGKLASHVYEESRLSQDETTAVKGRVEAGFSDLTDRVEGMEVKVESTLADAAQRVEKAVEQAELRAEGTSRHLSERFSAIEASVATKLSKVEEIDTRMKAVEGDVSGALTSMESTLTRIQDRLNRAETTTDAALKALEHTFASLDERIDSVAAMASPERAEALRQEFEQRFDHLAADLRASVEESRQKLADEIERAAAGASPELMGALESRINVLEAQNPADMLEGVGDQIAGLSETLDERIIESERRSAAAIEQVGDQVATAIKHVQARQEQSQRILEEKVAAAETRQETRLSEALCNISDRLAEMQNQTASAVSPVQKAIASLAARLESLEDFNAPPASEPVVETLPDMPAIDPVIDPITVAPQTAPVEADALTEPEFAHEPQIDLTASDEEFDFIAGLPDFDTEPLDTDSDEAADDSPDPGEWALAETDEDYHATESSDDLIEEFDPTEPVHSDPLAELGSWDEAQKESRESDVFAEEDLPFESSEPLEEDLSDNQDLSVIGLSPAAEELANNLHPETPEGEAGLLEPDEDATDYLSRARRAAIAAARTDESNPKNRKGRRSAASTSPKSASKSGRKLPILAAASVFAIAAAGAGGWVALRGKLSFGGDQAPKIVTKSNIDDFTTAEAGEPSLSGVEFAEDTTSLDATLFEEEGSVSGTAVEAPLLPAENAMQPDLPLVPQALTLERAAIEGSAVAQFQWGEARLAAQDYSTGSDFVRRAAEQGLPAAQYRLAKLHERGTGVPRDFSEARIWTEKAAKGGNIKAMHDLAVFFADGEGGSQSYAAAAEWFRKAADFGVVDSQYNLAVLYENGLGISPSQTEALYWYEVAAANGDAGAPGNIATLREALPLEQAQRAQRRAATWTAAQAIPASNGQFDAQDWEQSSRAQVLAIQTVLNGLGYDAGTPDGIAGAGTRTAIRAFQLDHGLETTGIIDDSLIRTLNLRAQS